MSNNGVYYPPVIHNGNVNSIFNNSDWVLSANDAKYVKISGLDLYLNKCSNIEPTVTKDIGI